MEPVKKIQNQTERNFNETTLSIFSTQKVVYQYQYKKLLLLRNFGWTFVDQLFQN